MNNKLKQMGIVLAVIVAAAVLVLLYTWNRNQQEARRAELQV